MNRQELDLQLTDEAAKYMHDPLGFTRFAYPWGEGSLKGYKDVDHWQAAFLTTLGEETKQRNFNGKEPRAARENGYRLRQRHRKNDFSGVDCHLDSLH